MGGTATPAGGHPAFECPSSGSDDGHSAACLGIRSSLVIHCSAPAIESVLNIANYHSGRNGDYQKITQVGAVHELLYKPASPGGVIRFFPAHPHEGAVGVPPGGASARVIATGESKCSGRPFNLIVAFESGRDEHGNKLRRAVAESSFHHFADYNWDTSRGAPSFVTEPEGQGVKAESRALSNIKQYVRNLAFWLAPS